MRINITGNAGAGKTTLALQISRSLNLPFVSLDSMVWMPGWKKIRSVRRRELEKELVERPSWVIDGVSERVRQVADFVIFLDVPRHQCAWRGLKRSLQFINRSRPELPENCPEWRNLPRLMRIIWEFPSKAGLVIRQEAEHAPDRYRIVTGPIDIDSVIGLLRPTDTSPQARTACGCGEFKRSAKDECIIESDCTLDSLASWRFCFRH